jgi:hypothetical protein
VQHVEVAVAVAVQMLGIGEEVGVRLAPREDRDVVPGVERSVDGLASEELRSAEDEQLHAA